MLHPELWAGSKTLLVICAINLGSPPACSLPLASCASLSCLPSACCCPFHCGHIVGTPPRAKALPKDSLWPAQLYAITYMHDICTHAACCSNCCTYDQFTCRCHSRTHVRLTMTLCSDSIPEHNRVMISEHTDVHHCSHRLRQNALGLLGTEGNVQVQRLQVGSDAGTESALICQIWYPRLQINVCQSLSTGSMGLEQCEACEIQGPSSRTSAR